MNAVWSSGFLVPLLALVTLLIVLVLAMRSQKKTIETDERPQRAQIDACRRRAEPDSRSRARGLSHEVVERDRQ